MFNEYKLLDAKVYEQDKSIEYFHPDSLDVISLNTKALDVFADFHTRSPRVINKDALASEALQKMIDQKVRALLVVNDQDQVIGLVGAAQLQGMILMQTAQQQGVTAKEVTVSMMMKPLNKLQMLDYKLLDNALVGHIARFLNENNLNHVLVYERDEQENMVIRGIFSASFIGRRLGMQIGHALSESSIADISRITNYK